MNNLVQEPVCQLCDVGTRIGISTVNGPSRDQREGDGAEQRAYLAVGVAVIGAGGQTCQVTEVLEQIQPRHADRLGLQLRHLKTHARAQN